MGSRWFAHQETRIGGDRPPTLFCQYHLIATVGIVKIFLEIYKKLKILQRLYEKLSKLLVKSFKTKSPYSQFRGEGANIGALLNREMNRRLNG